MAETVLSRTDTLSYLFKASYGIFNRAMDILNGPQRGEMSAERGLADPAWGQYGRLAMDGFRFTYQQGRDGADPLRFLRATTRPGEMPQVHKQERGNTGTFPADVAPPNLHRVSRALEIFYHSLATLSVLSSRGRVRLGDFHTAGVFDDERGDVFRVFTDWQRNYTGEGLWGTLKALDHTVRLVLLSPELVTTPADHYRVYEAACFFAAGRQLLTNPRIEESEREMVKRMLGKR
ncbi:hypothetical protein HYW42_01375 [Candidatus Daviesbacteria bacterium]|nr:hypothetical protein [Candidatus Daviesbacteria bacterium]